MDDSLLVRRLECLGDLLRDRQRRVNGNRPLRDPIGERGPLDQLHDQCVEAARILEAIDLRDVRMVERRKELRFPTEPCEAVGIVGQGGQQDLDRDKAIQRRITGAVDISHPARADERRDLVRANALPL
jgi:hypothetical protein